VAERVGAAGVGDADRDGVADGEMTANEAETAGLAGAAGVPHAATTMARRATRTPTR
jgi:hypothetical protein